MPKDSLAWEDLEVLLAAVEQGSLGRVSRALGTSQSTASRRLVRLEERLGGALFDRTPDGLHPTALALAIAPHAELVAGHMADIQRVAAGQEAAPEGRVRLAIVGGLAPFVLLPGLSRLRARHPGIELDLLAGRALVDLVRREADMALRFVPPTAPDLVCRRLFALQLQPFVHPDLADLGPERLPWVGLHDGEQRLDETRWLAKRARPAHLLRVTAWSDLLASVEAGLGAAILATQVAEQRGLVPVPAFAGEVVVEYSLFLVYHQALRHVPRIQAVREWLVDEATRRMA